MTTVYLADLRTVAPDASAFDDPEPPRVNSTLTGGTNVWIWPTLGVEDAELPESGDYIIFFLSNPGTSRLIGVGQASDITHSDSAYQMLTNSGFNEDVNDGYVLSIVNYQPVSSASNPVINDILGDEAELAKGMALRLVPPEAVEEHGFRPPLRGISKIDGLSTTGFTQPPESPDGGRYPNDPEGDDNRDGTGIDRTGPLLEQQYVGRDAVREASNSGLQITILLFGVIVASLSFLRDSISDGAVEITRPILIGAGAIGVGAILSATVIIVSVTNPRPEIGEVSDEQSATNEVVLNRGNQETKTALIEFSNLYHSVVGDLRSSNIRLGSLTSGAVGVALFGVFLVGYGVIQQIASIGDGVGIGVFALALCSAGLILLPLVLLPLIRVCDVCSD